MADNKKAAAFAMFLFAILNSSKLWVFGFFIALMYFKVVHHADISWVWVFGPFWIPMAMVMGIFVAFLAILFTGLGIAFIIDQMNRKV